MIKLKKKSVTHPLPIPVAEEKGPGLTKYRPILLVSIYRHAKVGLPEHGIALALDVTLKTWKAWKRRYPSIQEAIDLGRSEEKNGGNWHQFIFDRLSPDVRDLWEKINEFDEYTNGVVMIERLLSTHGKFTRQQLFLYALIHNNFSQSRAASKVNISKEVIDDWISNDPKFAQLVQELEWHKKNFFEESLVQLVAEKNPTIVKFANETKNRDRGYGRHMDVNHKGQINHTHGVLDFEELVPFLSAACQKEILEAMRQRDQAKLQERMKIGQTVEVKVLEHLNDAISGIPIDAEVVEDLE